jgi:hypothetical protein
MAQPDRIAPWTRELASQSAGVSRRSLKAAPSRNEGRWVALRFVARKPWIGGRDAGSVVVSTEAGSRHLGRCSRSQAGYAP